MASDTIPRRILGGLRAQFLLPTVALLVLTFLLSFMTLSKLHQTQQMQTLADNIGAQAELLALFGAKPSQSSMDAMARQGRVQGLVWRQGTESAHSGYLMPPAKWPEVKDGVVLKESWLGEDHVWIAYAKAGDVETAAVVDLAVAKSKQNLEERLIWIYILLGSGFLAILSWAGFTFLVIRPLRAIGVATERASQGDLTQPIKKTPPNELGQLAWRFNLMLTQLNTQRKRLETQLETIEKSHRDLEGAQTSLIRSEKLASVGQLAAGVAHEVGNPLAIVQGYSELLGDGDLEPEEVAMMGRKIAKQVERMQGIIRQLLDFSRDDSEEALYPIKLLSLCEEAVSLAQTTKRFRDVEVHLTPSLQDAPKVQGNTSQAIQVLLNLLLNAADALEEIPQGRVEISLLEVDDEMLELRVEDNGPGIEEGLHGKLFDPFFTTKEPGKGTGLGLAISKRIMERFEGDLEFIPNRPGACFALRFRRANKTQQDA